LCMIGCGAILKPPFWRNRTAAVLSQNIPSVLKLCTERFIAFFNGEVKTYF